MMFVIPIVNYPYTHATIKSKFFYLFSFFDLNSLLFSIIEINDSVYLICNAGKKLEKRSCPSGTYFSEGNGCQDPTKTAFRDIIATGHFSGSGRVGDACNWNTDCLSVCFFF